MFETDTQGRFIPSLNHWRTTHARRSPVQVLTNYCLNSKSSLTEQNLALWSSTITEGKIEDIEQVKKVALISILKENYQNYDQALLLLNLEKLQTRRIDLCLRFAKKCLKNEKSDSMFPLNPGYDSRLRNCHKFEVKFAHNSRLMNSGIPCLQRLLNEDNKKAG